MYIVPFPHSDYSDIVGEESTCPLEEPVMSASRERYVSGSTIVRTSNHVLLMLGLRRSNAPFRIQALLATGVVTKVLPARLQESRRRKGARK